ncbi:MAG: DUF4402 domain-containing protein [Polaromonas sp.]|nr:DUF4402 domain-containing protein [Polaromonas sp.]
MTMKMNKLALAIGALVMAGGTMAQSTASADGTANATVVKPIGITAGVTLEFGKVISTAHTVTIAPAGTRTDSITNTNAKGSLRAATFAVTGEPNFSYTITLPSTLQLDTLTSGTVTTMTTDTFTVAQGTNGSVAGTGTGAVGTLSGTGTGDLNVGAMLHVNANQVAGSYTKTYSVIVAYN